MTNDELMTQCPNAPILRSFEHLIIHSSFVIRISSFRLSIATIALLFSLLTVSAGAQTTLKAVIGWQDAARLGRWTPLFVTVADQQERSIVLQVQGSYGVAGSFLIRQRATVQGRGQATVYLLLIPLNAQPSRTAVTVSDESTGKTLARQVLEQPASFDPAGKVPVKLVQTDHTLIGISGDITQAMLLQAQLHRAGLVSGIIGSLKLPANAIGYEGISILVLDGGDFSDFDLLQQKSVVDWVIRGGNLVVIPGTDSLPAKGPIIAALPCEVGENRQVEPPATWGSTRPDTLNGRALSPRDAAQTLDMLGMTAYARRLGLGRIVVLPADVSPLQFPADRDVVALWRAILSGMATVPNAPRITEIMPSDEQEDIMPTGPRLADTVGRGPRETVAIRHILGLLKADGQDSGSNRGDALLWLVGICAIIGPLDSMLLMRLGRRPRNWVTVLGWAGLLASLGGYVAVRPADRAPQVRTFSLVDQVDNSAVARTDIVAIESNRDVTLPLDLDANEWWEPANQAAESFPANYFVNISFREDHHGCRPEQLALEAHQPQSLRGESAVIGPALLEANLKVTAGRIGGTLTNKSAAAMTDIEIQTAGGNCQLEKPLGAGATVQVDQKLTAAALKPGDLPGDAGDIAPDRTDRIDAMVKSGDWACIACQMPEAEAVAVSKGVSAVQHWEMVRAVVGLGHADLAARMGVRYGSQSSTWGTAPLAWSIRSAMTGPKRAASCGREIFSNWPMVLMPRACNWAVIGESRPSAAGGSDERARIRSSAPSTTTMG
jgi:hypothetical protein